MSWHRLNWVSVASGGLGLLGLFASVAIAQEPPLSVPAINGFLDWLRHPDTGEPPRGPRPGEGRFCIVNLVANVENMVWSDRPAFIVQGSPRSLALYRDTAQDPIWEYPVNEAEVVIYTGPPLEPDTTYTLRARHPQFPASIYEQRQLRTLSFDAEAQTTGNLLALEGETRKAGETSETAIAILKADYLWEQGLGTDAWATIWPLQSADSTVAGAIATGVDAFCNPAPTADLTLEMRIK